MNNSSGIPVKITIDMEQFTVTSCSNNLEFKYTKILQNIGTNEVRNMK